MTTANAAPSALDVNHLCASIRQPSPSRTGPGAEQHRVRAGELGLGHREARPDLAGGERAQPPVLLRGRAERVEELHVPHVGRLTVEQVRPHRVLAEHRAHLGVLGEREAEAA
jgi:hypothetical protein